MKNTDDYRDPPDPFGEVFGGVAGAILGGGVAAAACIFVLGVQSPLWLTLATIGGLWGGIAAGRCYRNGTDLILTFLSFLFR